MIRLMIRKTKIWNQILGLCALSGVDADEVLDMPFVEFLRRLRAARHG